MEIRPILSALLRNKTAPFLVALQVAISLAILSNALHIVVVRMEISQRPSGIGDEGAVFRIDATAVVEHDFNERVAQQARMKDALKAIPGVLSVATANQMPMTRNGTTTSVASDRKQSQPTADAAYYRTADSLVGTLQLKVVEGKDFDAGDTSEVDAAVDGVTPDVVIVTRALAQALYPDSDKVVGKVVLLGTGEDADALRIVGVVERLQTIGAESGARGDYSLIVPQNIIGKAARFAVRTEPGQRDRIIQAAESVLRKVADGAVVVTSSGADQDRVRRYRKDLALAWMLLLIGVLLLLITASGIVGMSTLWVTQRRKQIGVRRAIGARKHDILRYFIIENVLITTAGIGVGMLLAVALNEVLVRQLELSKLPFPFLLMVGSLFWLLGIIAVLGPALRAASISPAVATRST
jgi:putative ABC transport system permease protein